MAHVPYGQEPERIDIAPDVYAVKLGLYYHIKFPYNREAVEVMRMVATAHYAREMNGWAARQARHEDIRKALIKIDEILGPDRHAAREARERAAAEKGAKPAKPAKPQRVIVPVEDGVKAGQVLEIKKKHVTVERLGAPFTADSRYARWGKPEMVGAIVRYAYHRPSTEAEIEAFRQEQLEAQEAEVPEPDPDEDTSDQLTPEP